MEDQETHLSMQRTDLMVLFKKNNRHNKVKILNHLFFKLTSFLKLNMYFAYFFLQRLGLVEVLERT